MNEKSHAWIIAAFFNELAPFANGKDTFVKAAQRYGEERGYRMALRALRDNQPLNFASYMAYGEWRPTDASFYDGSVVSYNPDYENHNARCPWVETFVEISGWDCASTYCAQVDASIVRGFNPSLDFELIHPLGTDCVCKMVFRGANLDGPEKPKPLSSDTVRDWAYHCGHLFHVFSSTAHEVYGSKGTDAAQKVIQGFTDKFGMEEATEMLRQSRQNFRSIS